MSFKPTHIIIDRTNPVVMVNSFKSGTKVEILTPFGDGFALISNGRQEQYCHMSQLREIQEEE